MSAAEGMQGKQVFSVWISRTGNDMQQLALPLVGHPTRQHASSDTAEASWVMRLPEIDLVAGFALS